MGDGRTELTAVRSVHATRAKSQMCGIFGIVTRNRCAVDPDTVGRMAKVLRHRGPDHTGIHTGPGVALGNDRLAIIDLETGNQPIYNETGDLSIVFNGEIYNHRSLRRELECRGHVFRTNADTECILHAFEAFGRDCVHRLNGMFAFAIWNERQRELFLARDRLGIKPLYFRERLNDFAFASEPKALLAVLDEPVKPDWTALHRFFTFGYFPFGDSAFADIQKFPAGHYGWLRMDGRLKIERYWSPSFGQGVNISLTEAANTCEKLVERVIARELESDVPLGVFLSGGLDSALVAMHTRRLCDRRVPAFTLRFHEPTHDESAASAKIARHLDLDHRVYDCTEEELRQSLCRVGEHMDEPFGDSTVVPLLALSERARREVKVVLTGWGGDELFAGYPTYRAHRMAHWFRKLPRIVSRRIVPSLVKRLPVSDAYLSFEFKAKRFLRGSDLEPELQHILWMGYLQISDKQSLLKESIIEQVEEDTLGPVREAVARFPESDVVDRIMHLDAVTFLEANGLFQADRMTMASSLEARVPLLNNELVDFVAALPCSVKMKGGRLKALIRHMLRPHLPTSVLNAPKKGFGPPSAIWLRGIFADVVDSVFSRSRIEDQGIFRYPALRKLIDDHRARRADHGREIWMLLSFQLWYEKHVCDGDIGRLIG